MIYLLWPEDSFFILVANIIKSLLLLAVSTYTDPLNIKIPVINTAEDLLLLVASIYINPLVLI